MATASSRVLWKGAISFGLVHIPVALHSATSEQGLDFDWLDKRSMDPVGYKRINKKTGREIPKEQIVRGIEVEDGHYAVLSDEEIRAAYPQATQTIDIEAFVEAAEIPFVYLQRPYYVAPINRGAKVYALLREALLKTGRVGVARVVIQTKQHLAALVPAGPGLVLNLLRWSDEIRPWDQLDLPKAGSKAAGLSDKEMKMAVQLVEDMSGAFEPGQFKDEFKEQILELVQQKVKAGKTEAVVVPGKDEPAPAGAQIIDLSELLRQSLKKGRGATRSAPARAAPARKRAPARAAAKAPAAARRRRAA